MSSQRESVTVLEECIDLQKRKSQDYQNPNSNIVQAMHYRRGVSSIHDMVHQKLLRAQSLLEPLESGDGAEPNFESLEDTYKDAINYLSFAISYIRGKMEGQDPNRDMLNRAKPDNRSRKPSEPRTSLLGRGSGGVYSRVDESPAVESKIKTAYVDKVKPVGMITVPVDEPLINDALAISYIEDVAPPTVKDVMDRMEDDIAEHAAAIKSQGR